MYKYAILASGCAAEVLLAESESNENKVDNITPELEKLFASVPSHPKWDKTDPPGALTMWKKMRPINTKYLQDWWNYMLSDDIEGKMIDPDNCHFQVEFIPENDPIQIQTGEQTNANHEYGPRRRVWTWADISELTAYYHPTKGPMQHGLVRRINGGDAHVEIAAMRANEQVAILKFNTDFEEIARSDLHGWITKVKPEHFKCPENVDPCPAMDFSDHQ